VQDIFLTETAYLADVVLPATAWPEKVGTVTNTDRMVQLGRKAIDSPGDARPDFDLLVELGQRMGLDWQYTHPREVFDEMRVCMDSIAGHHLGAARARVVGDLSVREGRRPGDPVVFIDNFPTASGRGKFVPAGPHLRRRAAGCRVPDSAHHRPSARALAHRVDDPPLDQSRLPRARAGGVDSPARPRSLGVEPGGTLTIASRRGEISLYARADDGTPRGSVFVPFCYYEAGRQHADQPGARPVREDPGVQVLRGQGLRGRHPAGENELRRRRPATG
jgi:formate dehydrogenase major subunit